MFFSEENEQKSEATVIEEALRRQAFSRFSMFPPVCRMFLVGGRDDGLGVSFGRSSETRKRAGGTTVVSGGVRALNDGLF